jgi:hypothetical protein
VTWTWDETDISTDLAKVRVRIGDTNTNDELLSDEVIDSFLDVRSDVVLAAIDCCRAIIAKLSRDVDRSNLGMSASRSQKVQHYRDLLAELQKQAAESSSGAPRIGGISKTAKDDVDGDSDRVAPAFRRGQFDR